MDADYYLETIRTVFQEFKLVHGTWDVLSPQGRVERVRPQDIRGTAILTVEGELDDISGSGQTEAAHSLCTGVPKDQQKHMEIKGAGHYGIFSGRRWREVVYPAVREFILAHPQPLKPVTVPAAAARKPAASAKTARPAKASAKSASKPVSKAGTQAARKATTGSRRTAWWRQGSRAPSRTSACSAA